MNDDDAARSAVLTILYVPADRPDRKEARPKDDEDLLQGSWRLVYERADGREEWHHKDDSLLFRFEKGKLFTVKGKQVFNLLPPILRVLNYLFSCELFSCRRFIGWVPYHSRKVTN